MIISLNPIPTMYIPSFFRASHALYSCLVAVLLPGLGLAQDKDLSAGILAKVTWAKDAHAVISEDNRLLEIDNAGRAVLTVSTSITVLDEEGKSAAYFAEFYDEEFDRLAKVELQLYNAFGKMISRKNKKDLSDEAYSNWNEVGGVRVISGGLGMDTYPYTVKHTYTKILKQLMYMESWHPVILPGTALEAGKFTVVAPADLSFRYKGLYGMPEPRIETGKKGEQIYHWELAQVGPSNREPYSPEAPRPKLLLAPDQFEIDGYEGSASTWQSFGAFIYDLNKDRHVLPTDRDPQLASLLAGIEDPKVKAAVIYRYLQDRTRYVSIQLGIGGFQSIPAERVVATGYGDCKALTHYMKGLLEREGIPSFGALVRAGANSLPIDSDFPSQQFNHIILCIPFEGDTTWVECTSSTSPFGYLSDFTEDKHVLLLSEDGGQLIRTPFTDPNQQRQDRLAKVVLAPNGQAEVAVAVTYLGSEQDYIRSLIAQGDRRDEEQYLRDLITAKGTEPTQWTFTASPSAPQCNLSLTLASRNWAKKSGNRLFLPLHQLEAPISVPEAVPNRNQPVLWRKAFTHTDSVYIDVPDGFAVEAIPEKEVLISRPYASYDATIEQTESGDLIWVRTLRIEKTRLSADAYEDFREFFRTVNKAERRQVVLSNRS